jgi:pyruvate dehydrogenase E2 component (dihydrolipoyllysine-residue acetyltransferase)
MATKISMPKLSDTMEEGIILKWLKKEGEAVKQGETLAEVQTDKADMELEAYDTGIVRKIFVPEGKGAAVGKPIAIIGTATEDISKLLDDTSAPPPAHTANVQAPAPAEQPVVIAPPATADSPSKSDGDLRVKASPLAKKIAQVNHIDLEALSGSGPLGRIIKKDVERALTGGGGVRRATTMAGKTEEIPLSLMRKTIAKRLTESKTTAPHFYLTYKVDMTRAIDFRTSLNAAAGTKISYNDLIVASCAAVLRIHRQVNASFAGDKIIRHGHINVGIAVALEDGLITPVIRDADLKSIVEISDESKALAAKAREKKLKGDEFSGGTFTVSNLGMFGVEEFSAIINPPEGAILAVGAITETAVVENGHVGVGHRMKLTLSCDHRVVDGATGAQFMQDLKRVLENPALIALDFFTDKRVASS